MSTPGPQPMSSTLPAPPSSRSIVRMRLRWTIDEDAVHAAAVSLGRAVVPLRVVPVELRLGRRRGGLRQVAAAAADDAERVPGRGIPRIEERLGLGARMAAGGGAVIARSRCRRAVRMRARARPGPARARRGSARRRATVASDGTDARMSRASTAVSGGSPRNETETRSTGTWRSAQLYTVWPPMVQTTASPKHASATLGDGRCATPPATAVSAAMTHTTAYTIAEYPATPRFGAHAASDEQVPGEAETARDGEEVTTECAAARRGDRRRRSRSCR